MPAMAQRTARQVRAIYADHLGAGPEYALLECAAPDIGCLRSTRIEDSEGRSDAELTPLFEARGWTVKPVRCPEHIGIPRREAI